MALLLLPIWSVQRYPSADGACHLYNAWVMHHLHDPAHPLLASHFRIDLAPIPNWLIQVLLYGLLFVVRPVLAEKLLLTLYVFLFAAAAWSLAGCRGERGAPYAFLALPFSYPLLLHLGFYNFAFSVPLCLLAVGCWWRGRDRPGPSFALRINLLLLLVYFAHLVSLAVALLTLGALWLSSREGRPWRLWWRHPLLLLPQLPLPLWYLASHHGGAVRTWPQAPRWAYLLEQRALFVFHGSHLLGAALATLIAALLAAALVRRRPAGEPPPWPFLLAALAVVALFLAAPDEAGGGGWVLERLSLFPFLLVLPALPHSLPGPRAAFALAFTMGLLVAFHVRVLVERERELAAEVDAYLAGLASVQPHTRVLALSWDPPLRADRAVLVHAVDWVAIEKGLVDWDDYQADSGLFPVHFQPGLVRPRHDADLRTFPLDAFASTIDELYTWHLPPYAPLLRPLRERYRLVATTGPGRLWRRQGPEAAGHATGLESAHGRARAPAAAGRTLEHRRHHRPLQARRRPHADPPAAEEDAGPTRAGSRRLLPNDNGAPRRNGAGTIQVEVKEHGGLIRLLAESGVDFIVIGGVAGALLGAARATFDLDVVYSRREENLARLASALTPVHVYLRGAPPGLPFRFDLPTLQRGLNFTLTTDLGNLDILGEVVGGGGYEQLLPKSHEIEAFGARFRCIDLDALIAVKRAAGRPKDFEAIAELEIIRDERSRTAKDAEGPREPTTRGDG